MMMRHQLFGFAMLSAVAAGLLVLLSGCDREHLARYGPFHVTTDSTVWFDGGMGSRVDRQFNRLLDKHPHVKTVTFSDHCPGSNDDESLYVAARRMRQEGIRTVLNGESVVESGAVDLFLSGASRRIATGAKIGVHSWSFNWGNDGVDLPADDPEHDMYLDFYGEMFDDAALGEEFYWFTLNAASGDDIHYMTAEEIAYFQMSTE